MSRQEVIRVTCDVCGDTLDLVPDEVDLVRYTVPTKATDLLMFTRQSTIDLCRSCALRLAIIMSTPVTEERYDPTAFEMRPFPTGSYTYEFMEDA